MKNTIDKQAIDRLIDTLGDGCRIGNVLEKMPESNCWRSLELRWQPCGFTKSLQEIFSEEAWETTYCNPNGSYNALGIKELKEPQRQLAEFLISLNL